MKKRTWSWLLAMCLMLSLLPLGAAATETAEAYQLLKDTDGYTVYTSAEYPWTLDDSGVYTSQNTVSVAETISSLKIVFKSEGVVSFNWTTAGIGTDVLAYRISEEDYAQKTDFTGQSTNKYSGEQLGTEEALEVAANDTLYIALFRYKDTSTGTATISNFTLSPIYDGEDTVVEDHIVFNDTMGTVAVDWMEQKTNYDNSTYYQLSSVAESAVEVGQTYRLKATAATGYQFYGWVREYTVNGVQKTEFMPMKYYTLATATGTDNISYNTQTVVTAPELEATLDETSAYRAVFAPTGSYALRVNAEFYDSSADLAGIINNASSGDVIQLLGDITLTQDATLAKGALLYVPFRSGWSEDDVAGNYRANGNIGYTATPEINYSNVYATLTVNSGITLTVNGQLAVGSVVGYNSQRMQGHISGVHGKITNNGTVLVASGGTMTCYGLVDGSGTVRVNDGGILREMFMIGDFAGGSNTAELFFTSQMPFKRFSMQRVQCTLMMESSSKLMAMMHVWASSMYNEAEVVLFGNDTSAAFYPTSATAGTLALTRTYNASQALTDGNGLLDASGIGRTEWTFSNGLKFQPLTISLGGISVNTGSSDFTIPYNFKIRLISGTYDIPIGMRIMPGAEIVVESGASVNIGGRLMVMDGLVQTDMSGDRYPTRSELTAAGFSGSGELTVNGTLTMQNGSTLGGLVKNNGTGKLVIGDNVYVSNSGTLSALDQKVEIRSQNYDLYTSEGGVSVTVGSTNVVHNWVQQDGAKGAYDENTTWFNLPARIYTEAGVQQVEAGKTYLATGLSTPETVTYTAEYLYVQDDVYVSGTYYTSSGAREMASATETLNRTVYGAWEDSEASNETVEVTKTTVAGHDELKVICSKEKSGTSTLLTELTVVDAETEEAVAEKYVFLVKYTTEGDTTGITVSPNDDGSYTILPEANGVIIEACLKGDLNGNGALDGRDVANLKKATVDAIELSELAILAADLNGNGALDGRDVANLKKATVGSYTIT